MLSPDSRRLLLRVVQPPAGYTFDRAIITSFTLDLQTLLTVPLAFTFQDWEDARGRPTGNPLAVLESLRRHAGHISVFCEAARISVPPRNQPLFAYLESSVVEVTAPAESGVFHPKVWVLRYVAASEAPHYRVLVLSRNLTFDRSWDTLLTLEGALQARSRDIARNRPLQEFVKALPSLAIRKPVEGRIQEDVDLISRELGRVDFQAPPDVEDFAFHPLGIPGYRSSPLPRDPSRLLVVSPFLSDRFVAQLVQVGGSHILASRPEVLMTLRPGTLARFSDVRTLRAEAVPPVDDDAADRDMGDDEELGPTGLHAKLFVADEGWRARLWTGSANATTRAFTDNVEFLVELRGLKSCLGIDRLLCGTRDDPGMSDLLEPYQMSEEAVSDEPDDEAAALEAARQVLIRGGLVARVEERDGTEGYSIVVVGAHLRERDALGEQVRCRCWPVTLHRDRGVQISRWDRTEIARFTGLSVGALTGFFAFELDIPQARAANRLQFVMDLPLENAPEARYEQLLRQILADRGRVLYLLQLLLTDNGMVSTEMVGHAGRGFQDPAESHGLWAPLPLFEGMMAALRRQPEQLKWVASLVEDLSKTEEGRALLPDDFASVWEPVWAVARRRLQ